MFRLFVVLIWTVLGNKFISLLVSILFWTILNLDIRVFWDDSIISTFEIDDGTPYHYLYGESPAGYVPDEGKRSGCVLRDDNFFAFSVALFNLYLLVASFDYFI